MEKEQKETNVPAEETQPEGTAAAIETDEGRKKRPGIHISFKTIALFGAAILVGLLAYASKGFFVAATVDGSPISRFSIMREAEKQAGKDMLESIIVERLIRKEAAAKGMTATDEEVDSEIQKISGEIAAQGAGTLEEALAAEGLSMEDFRKQIAIQKEVEKLLADKITVTDDEVTQFMEENEIEAPAENGENFLALVKEQIAQQKFSEEIGSLIETLKAQASIRYFVNY